MAELHVIGQIYSAQGFPSNSLCCKWGLHCEGGWTVIEGSREGQTQTDASEIDESAYFCHPIDIHLSTRSIQGWPKIHLQVFHLDSFGRQEIYGYGACSLPTRPGEHELVCSTWRPSGSARDEIGRRFIGGGVQLKDPKLIYSNIDRYRLITTTMGTVTLHIGLIMRNFDKFGIEC